MQLLGKNKKWWLAGSLTTILLGAVALGVWGLKYGIDFTGGSLLEVSSAKPIDREAFQKELEAIGVEKIITQTSNDGGVLVKSATISQEQHSKVNELLAKMELKELRFENVGPTVGKDLTQKALLAIGLASLAIILYIAYSFRNVPHPASSWRFGVTAILALVHDAFITIGAFALLGHFFGYEVDALFITALLTIIGFSVHDTIVVFDRLRENMIHDSIKTVEQFESVANDSLVQTLIRSLNTSLTVILVLLAMALLGGETIRPFVVALLIGMTVGTYSSIAVATPILVYWQDAVMNKRFRWPNVKLPKLPQRKTA
jgi:preprotein translocase subunit SecF